MAKQREIFLQGAYSRGVDRETAARIFDVMEKFAGYGFNKSHSAAYALLSYQTAWLKAHYPAEFMAAVLSSDMDHTDKVVSFYRECEAMGLTVLAPNINLSYFQFTVNAQGELTYGLGAIKGVGESAVLHMVEEREKNGIYRDLFDFCKRVDLHKVSRRTLEPLIFSGAMDCFGVNRATLLASIDSAIKAALQHSKNVAAGQSDLFSLLVDQEESSAPDYCIMPEEEMMQRLTNEKNVMGLYLSGHPIKIVENEIRAMTTAPLHELSRYIGKSVTIAGLLINVKKVVTKQGRRMAILTVEDRTGQIEATLFNKLYETMAPYLQKNEVFVLHGKIEEDSYSHSPRMVVESIDHLDQKRAETAKRLVIFAENSTQMNEWMLALPTILKPYSGGQCPVMLTYKNESAKVKLALGDAWRVTPKNALLSQLKQLCGEEQVKVAY